MKDVGLWFFNGSQQLLIVIAGGVVTVSVLGFAGYQLKKRHTA